MTRLDTHGNGLWSDRAWQGGQNTKICDIDGGGVGQAGHSTNINFLGKVMSTEAYHGNKSVGLRAASGNTVLILRHN